MMCIESFFFFFLNQLSLKILKLPKHHVRYLPPEEFRYQGICGFGYH